MGFISFIILTLCVLNIRTTWAYTKCLDTSSGVTYNSGDTWSRKGQLCSCHGPSGAIICRQSIPVPHYSNQDDNSDLSADNEDGIDNKLSSEEEDILLSPLSFESLADSETELATPEDDNFLYSNSELISDLNMGALDNELSEAFGQDDVGGLAEMEGGEVDLLVLPTNEEDAEVLSYETSEEGESDGLTSPQSEEQQLLSRSKRAANPNVRIFAAQRLAAKRLAARRSVQASQKRKAAQLAKRRKAAQLAKRRAFQFSQKRKAAAKLAQRKAAAAKQRALFARKKAASIKRQKFEAAKRIRIQQIKAARRKKFLQDKSKAASLLKKRRQAAAKKRAQSLKKKKLDQTKKRKIKQLQQKRLLERKKKEKQIRKLQSLIKKLRNESNLRIRRIRSVTEKSISPVTTTSQIQGGGAQASQTK